MPWYNIITLIFSALGLSTIVGLFWKDLHDKKAKEREENSDRIKKQKKQEQKDAIREVLDEVFAPACTTMGVRLDVLDKKIDLLSGGTLSALRNDILKNYYQCRDKGYRNDYDFANMHDLYESYKDLGGNSFITDIMERFDALPTKEEYQEQKRKEEQRQNTRSKGKKEETEGGAA